MDHYDFIAIDFETANHNYNSACAIGIAAVKDFEIVDTFYSLINPNTEFDPGNIQIHGITQEDVKDSPDPAGLWFDISYFFGHYAVLAHNAYFDMSVLKRSFDFLDRLDFKYIDTVSLCKEFVPGKKSLDHCAEFFNIEMGHHHNALDDAITCAKIAISCIKASECENIGSLCFALPNVKINQFSELTPPESAMFHKKKSRPDYAGVRPSDIQISTDALSANPDNPFYGKIIVFTGALSISREDAMRASVSMGATVKGTVTKKTDYLVVGVQDEKFVGAGGTSSKEKKAAALNADGAADISIISEKQFLSILQWEAYDDRF